MVDKFCWLHISDFHFEAGEDRFSQTVSCDAVLQDIPERLTSEYPLEFIVVTGDIAFSGKANEYDLASEFFATLMSRLGVDHNRVCIVPGNHDVDRTVQRYMYGGVRADLKNQQDVDEFLGRSAECAQLLERQSAFFGFKNQLLDGVHFETTEDGLACARLLDLDGFRISVLELNSAWLSGDKDQAGNLLIGERQIINALNLADKNRPHLTMALAHHPPDWLAEFDSLSFNRRLVPRLNIFHNGHLHRHDAKVIQASGGYQCLHSAAGSSHSTRHYRNAYNLVEHDVGNAVCRIRQFEYDPDSGQFREMESTEYPMRSTRGFTVSAADVAIALRDNIPAAEPFADYMAALLVENLDEVPVSLADEGITFASKRLPPEFQFREVEDFLRISNLIRIYDEVPLSALMSDRLGTIVGFAGLLSRTSSADSEFADMLSNRRAQAQKIAGSGTSDDPPYQVQFLDDLAQTGPLGELIDAAIRFQESTFDEVQITANRHLAIAFLQSDDLDRRQEGLQLAFRNLDASWAIARDYCVAAGAAEIFQDYPRAEATALAALEKWPEDDQLRKYCRSLITQTGSRILRRRLDETGMDTI